MSRWMQSGLVYVTWAAASAVAGAREGTTDSAITSTSRLTATLLGASIDPPTCRLSCGAFEQPLQVGEEPLVGLPDLALGQRGHKTHDAGQIHLDPPRDERSLLGRLADIRDGGAHPPHPAAVLDQPPRLQP